MCPTHSMGENIPTLAGSTVFRENTVLSMNQAASFGAAFVEFDVQVTRDGMPVIWHDDHVLTGAVSAPTKHMISELSLAQFKKLLSGSSGPLLRAFKDNNGGRYVLLLGGVDICIGIIFNGRHCDHHKTINAEQRCSRGWCSRTTSYQPLQRCLPASPLLLVLTWRSK